VLEIIFLVTIYLTLFPVVYIDVTHGARLVVVGGWSVAAFATLLRSSGCCRKY
jgi:hypothetical protein